MSEPIKINLNDTVRIRLNPKGEEMIREHYARLVGVGLPADTAQYLLTKLQPDAEGYVEMQMWQMAHLFGPSMAMHLPPPIKTEILVRKST